MVFVFIFFLKIYGSRGHFYHPHSAVHHSFVKITEEYEVQALVLGEHLV